MRLVRLTALVILALALLAAPLAAEAQPAGKVYRIGWLHPQPPPKSWLAGFDQGLREFGYVEGRNLIIFDAYFSGIEKGASLSGQEYVQLVPDVSDVVRDREGARLAIPPSVLARG